MEPLTDKQGKVLEFIEQRLGEYRPPSQREIARHFGMAQNAAYQLIGYLKKKGYVVDEGGHRGLRLDEAYLRRRKASQGLPVVGRVAAGEPILAEENIDAYIDLKEVFEQSDGRFVLKIVGDSMVDEGIMDGDYVVVQAGSQVRDGQIGVVMLDDEATVKRIYFQRNRIALESANRAAGYRTRYIRQGEKDVRIIGRVIGCFRMNMG